MKTKRLDFNFRPLKFSKSISLVGTTPGIQTYDAETGEYSPDYTTVPVVVQPSLSAIDPDEVMLSGPINAQLTNITWTEIEAGVKKTIDTTNTQYGLTMTGDDAGRVVVNRNATPGSPITLQFDADFIDPRTEQVTHFTMTYPIKCKNATLCQPVVLLDASDVSFYNPLRDQAEQTINASLLVGSVTAQADKCAFVWEVLRDSGAFTKWGSNELDLEASVSEDGASFTVDRSLMGKKIVIRCRAKYSSSGNPASVPLKDSAPAKIVSIVRRIPKFEYDWADVPINLPGGQKTVLPRTIITDKTGVIPNPSAELLPIYYMATNPKLASGGPSYEMVGHGMQPTLSTDKISVTTGAIMGLDVKELNPLMLLTDGKGTILTDDKGTAFVFH